MASSQRRRCLSLASKSGGMQESSKAVLRAPTGGPGASRARCRRAAVALGEAGPAVDCRLVHRASILSLSLSAQPVLSRLLQLSDAFAEHMEGRDQSSIPVRKDFGGGLCDGRGVHGGESLGQEWGGTGGEGETSMRVA